MSYGSRVVKRRRFVRRKAGKRTSNFTSQFGHGGGMRFRAKKLSASRWRRVLWNDTLSGVHYRSNSVSTSTINTPAFIDTMKTAFSSAFRFAGQQFYVASGGAIAPDAAVVLPIFEGNVVIRGGVIGMRIANVFDTLDTNRNTLHGFVYLVKTTKNFSSATIPSTVSLGWDPSLIPDWNTNIGKIVYRKQFLLRDGDTADIEYRLKINKLDIGDYIADKNTYLWIVAAGNVDVSASRSLIYSMYYNMSFAAV